MGDEARQARALFRETAPRTPAEQAALDVINAHKWALWHADDRDLAVMLLLSRKGLLRDLAQEKHEEATAIANTRLVIRNRQRDAVRINTLDAAIEQACKRLTAGEDPGEVAAWLKEVRARTLN